MGDPQFGQQPFSIGPQILGIVQHAKIVTIRVPVFTVGEESGTYIITLYLYNNTIITLNLFLKSPPCQAWKLEVSKRTNPSAKSLEPYFTTCLLEATVRPF